MRKSTKRVHTEIVFVVIVIVIIIIIIIIIIILRGSMTASQTLRCPRGWADAWLNSWLDKRMAGFARCDGWPQPSSRHYYQLPFRCKHWPAAAQGLFPQRRPAAAAEPAAALDMYGPERLIYDKRYYYIIYNNNGRAARSRSCQYTDPRG